MQLNIITENGPEPRDVISQFEWKGFQFFVNDNKAKSGHYRVTEKKSGCIAAYTIDGSKEHAIQAMEDRFSKIKDIPTYIEKMIEKSINQYGEANK